MGNVQIFDTVFAMTVLVILAVCVPLLLLFANWLLHPARIKGAKMQETAYECGIAHVSGTSNERFPVKYYMVAMLFLIFDLEVAFIYPWAVEFLNIKSWSPLFILLGFLVILEAGYTYIVKKGVLNWTKIQD